MSNASEPLGDVSSGIYETNLLSTSSAFFIGQMRRGLENCRSPKRPRIERRLDLVETSLNETRIKIEPEDTEDEFSDNEQSQQFPRCRSFEERNEQPSFDLELNKALLKLFDCPVCLDCIYPPVMQCKRGHLLCRVCRERLTVCPLCRSKLSDYRNLAMESVASKLQFPCVFNYAGCPHHLYLDNKLQHEQNCMYRVYVCHITPCNWKGQHQDIVAHVRSEHPTRLLCGSEHTLRFPSIKLAGTHYKSWIIWEPALEQIFRVHCLVQPNAVSAVSALVQYVGPANSASSFSYRIAIKNAQTSRRITYYSRTESDVQHFTTLYDAGDCLALSQENALKFVMNDTLSFTVAVHANHHENM